MVGHSGSRPGCGLVRSLSSGALVCLPRRASQLERVLRCFVPKLVEERVEGGQTGSWAAEVRPSVACVTSVTVM